MKAGPARIKAFWLNLDQGYTDLIAHLTLTPPPGAPLRRFRLNYSVINERS